MRFSQRGREIRKQRLRRAVCGPREACRVGAMHACKQASKRYRHRYIHGCWVCLSLEATCTHARTHVRTYAKQCTIVNAARHTHRTYSIILCRTACAASRGARSEGNACSRCTARYEPSHHVGKGEQTTSLDCLCLSRYRPRRTTCASGSSLSLG